MTCLQRKILLDFIFFIQNISSFFLIFLLYFSPFIFHVIHNRPSHFCMTFNLEEECYICYAFWFPYEVYIKDFSKFHCFPCNISCFLQYCQFLPLFETLSQILLREGNKPIKPYKKKTNQPVFMSEDLFLS